MQPTEVIAAEPPGNPLAPLAILNKAIERGVDAAQLEKLTDLAERWAKQEAAAAFANAMSECQREMPRVVKDADNSQTHSKYARLESVNKAITPVYTKYGLSLSYGTDESHVAGHIRIICDVSHRLGHSRRYQIDLPPDVEGIKGNANKTPVHGAGSTISYGRRYLAMMIFNLALVGEDDDVQNANECIGADEMIVLNTLLEEKGANLDRFLKFCGIASLDLMRKVDFASRVASLQAMKPKKGATT